MLVDLQLKGWLNAFWQFNLDLSVIVLTVLVVRFFIRKTTKSYNSYLLWLAIPMGFVVAKVIASIDFTSASSSYIGHAVSAMIIKPVETLQNYWWLGALWLSGTALLLLRLIIQHIELRRDLKHIRRPLNELPGGELFKSRHYPVIAVEHKELSPAVYGFVKPKIYFPIHVAHQLSAQQIQLIIEHEEQHIKQKHLWLNLLWDVLVCVGWFNPLIYIARKDFRHDQELFCDYLVLNKTSQSRTKDYGHALLSTVSATHSVSLLCSWKVFNQLEERIMNITKPINRKGKAALTLGATLVLGCSALYAANKEVKETPEADIVVADEMIVDTNSQEKVIVKYVGNVARYIQEDDKFYVEENGQRREMTEAERIAFEHKHEQTMKELQLSEKEMLHIEKEIEEAHQELELHADEIELAQEEIEHAHQAIDEAQKDIELEFKNGHLSKEQMEQARKSLQQAKEQMSKEKVIVKVDMDRAKQDLNRAKAEIREKRLRIHSRAPDSGTHRVITIDENLVKDTKGHRSHVIKLVDDSGKVYLKKDGDYRVKADGKERDMTSEEKAFFDEKVKSIPAPSKPPQPEQPSERVSPPSPVTAVTPPMPPKAVKSPAKPVHQPRPTYPQAAMDQNIEGFVNLKFDIGNSGEAKNIRVINSSNSGLFNKDAIDAVKEWEFSEQDYGKKGMEYQMNFALDSKDLGK